MIDKKLVQKIDDVRQKCASVKMPVDVETDNTPDGIDGVLIMGDIGFTGGSDVYDIDFVITLRYSTAKSNWKEFLERIGLLSQKLVNEQRYMCTGWTKTDDISKLIYSCNINLKGRINAD